MNKNLSSFFDSISDVQQKKLNGALTRAIYATSSALSLVKNKNFLKFIKFIRLLYVPPSRYTLSNKLLKKEYKIIKKVVKTKIAKEDNVSIVTDF